MCKWSKWGNTRIDPCMRPLIKYLRSLHVNTLACCCGHGKYPMTIVALCGFGQEPCEILSGVWIPRKKRFYKRDKEGIYYIPEVVNVK